MPLTLFFFLLSFLPLTQVVFFATGSGAVREVLLTRWEGRDDQELLYGLLPAGVDHGKLMGRARFCLCLTGDDEGAAAASRRVVEAITAGCCTVGIAVSLLRCRRRFHDEDFVLLFHDWHRLLQHGSGFKLSTTVEFVCFCNLRTPMPAGGGPRGTTDPVAQIHLMMKTLYNG
uniref:Uncharacterized protein n=3 Tax=Oryza TaxID=4527 RepID=Q2R5P3_ORYSJ|nr:hypothetical protein LOC_Os11g24300 [Oryza sativa Japonica Group]ABA93271.1 hypothetical protein LOC_Os11g24300 [Oryza sativa Japonica Group]